MQPEWIIGITSTLIIIIIAILKARGQTRPGLSTQHYIKPNGMLSDEEAIRNQLRRGNKINAIKLYRVQAGVGLKEAKYAVEMMNQEMHQTQISDSAENDKEIDKIERMVSMGNKINAIKLYRQQTGVGLREAKDAIERMAPGLKAENTVSSNQPMQGQVDPGELQRLLLAGQKIQAIKYYRETTGVGLKEAKDAVERMAPGLKTESTNQPVQGQVDPDELQRLLLARQKIQAIKYYRETTGVGLKEAKDAVDWLEAQMHQ